MLKKLNYNDKNFFSNLGIIISKRSELQSSKTTIVKKIISNVKKGGDKALIAYEKKFSKNKKISIRNIKFTEKEINKICKLLDNKIKKSIDLSFNRIIKFHKNQKYSKINYKDKYNNNLKYKSSPIESVGVYVPGGTSSYPSSVLMNCIPAMVAGVKKIIVATPSQKKNLVNPAIIYAAKKCNVNEIYKVGGAQAIAALAYGTKSINKVDKIVGPGNAYVATAKKEVFGKVGIDMIAGPSEVTVVSDKKSNPEWIAADLIAQAEHDDLAQVIHISSDKNKIKTVNEILKKKSLIFPKSKTIRNSLKNFGLSVYVKNNNKLINLINFIAPEHLQLNLEKPQTILNKIKNAGSIFIGEYSAEAFGDYLAGPNHVLPTSGAAKFSSGLSVYDFLKRQSYIKISKTGVERLGSSVIRLAKYENLDGHAYSIEVRKKV